MSGCAELRGRLGAFVAGALGEAEADEVAAHIEGCLACSAELAELVEVDEALRAARIAGRGTRARRRPRSVPALAAAVLVCASVVAYATRRPPPNRVRRGALLAAGARLSGGARVPLEGPLESVGPSILALGDGSVIAADAGARFALLGPRGVRLERGALTFHVQRGAGRFVAETPSGSITVLGTTFRVSLQEGAPMAFGPTARLAAGTIVAIAVTSGVVLYKSHDGSVEAEIKAGERAVADAQAIHVEAEQRGAEAVRLREEAESLRRENEALRSEAKELARAKAELEAAAKGAAASGAVVAAATPRAEPAAPVGQASAAGEKKGMAIRFGGSAKLPEVVNADWREMGEAANAMRPLLVELGDFLKKGGKMAELPSDIGIKFAKENVKLQKFAFAVYGKLPTHAPGGNGEWTDPIAFANVLAAALDVAGQPLVDAQIAGVTALGDEYQRQWDRQESGYTPETFALEKLLDELELKHRFVDQVEALLTPEQRSVVIIPGVHDVNMIDVYSPILLATPYGWPLSEKSRDGLRAALMKALAEPLSLDDGQQAVVAPMVDRWLRSLDGHLVPVEASHVQFFNIDDAIAGGRATLALKKDLVATLHLDPDVQKKIAADAHFFVPRLIAEAAKK